MDKRVWVPPHVFARKFQEWEEGLEDEGLEDESETGYDGLSTVRGCLLFAKSHAWDLEAFCHFINDECVVEHFHWWYEILPALVLEYNREGWEEEDFLNWDT